MWADPSEQQQGVARPSPSRTWLHVPTLSQPRLSCPTTLAREGLQLLCLGLRPKEGLCEGGWGCAKEEGARLQPSPGASGAKGEVAVPDHALVWA